MCSPKSLGCFEAGKVPRKQIEPEGAQMRDGTGCVPK